MSSLYCWPPATDPAPQTTWQFSCVSTALTPGSACAFETSIDLDARVRMRAAQHARVQHARQLDVARVVRVAGHALDGVDARRRVADGLHRRDAGAAVRRGAVGCWLIAHLPRSSVRRAAPAATTAST